MFLEGTWMMAGPTVQGDLGRAGSVALVVIGGDAPAGELVAELLRTFTSAPLVIAADSGAAHALTLGLAVDIAVGDFDSLDPARLRALEEAGAEIRRHPPAKDATDFELALDVALECGCARVVVVGGHGGRLDHFLANALLLASDRYASVAIEAIVGGGHVHVVRPGEERRVAGTPGEYLTVLPVHGPVTGVHLSGLRWELHDETLEAGSSRGVSNQFSAEIASVRIGSGVVLVIRPGSSPTSADADIEQPSIAHPTQERP